MPSPSPDVRRLASLYRPALPDRPVRGLAGELLGRGTGSSLEFQDRRNYVPGDDLRHLDWRAYARTDQLLVRQYREEIVPRLDVLVDDSRSMALDDDKARLAVDLAALVALAGREAGLSVRVFALGDAASPIELERFAEEGVALSGARALAPSLDEAAPLLRPGAVRVLVSDFLSPHDSRRLVRTFAARAGAFTCLQILGREDAEPPEGAAYKLTDAETAATVDLVLDRHVVERYRARLRRLCDALQSECRRAGGNFLSLVARGTLDEHCRERLVPAGILVPA